MNCNQEFRLDSYKMQFVARFLQVSLIQPQLMDFLVLQAVKTRELVQPQISQ